MRPTRSESWPRLSIEGTSVDHVAAEEERHDGVAEAELVLVEGDQRGDQAGAEREQHQHRPGAPDAAHRPTSTSADEAAPLGPPRRRAGRGPGRRRRPPGPRPGRSPDSTAAARGRADAPQQLAVGGGGERWRAAPARRSPRRRAPRAAPGAGRPARQARRRQAARGLVEGARVEIAGDHRPAPQARPGLGQQARAAAGVERRPGRQGLERLQAHRRGGVARRAEALAGGLHQLAHARPGRAAWAGLRRYQPATMRAGGSGQPGTSASGAVGEGAGAPAPARPARAPPAARRPGPPRRSRTGCRAQRPGKAAVSAALVAASTSRPAGSAGRPVKLRARGPPPPPRSRRCGPRAAQPAVAALSLDERLARAARSRAALAAVGEAVVDRAVAEAGQPRRFARRELESALGLLDALPALAEAIRPRPVPATCGVDAAGVGALRGGARLARRQLAGLGAHGGGRLGAGGGQRASWRAPRAARGAPGRWSWRRSARPWPAGRDRARSTCPAPRPSRWCGTPTSTPSSTHASTATCKRQLAGLGRGLRRRRAPAPLHRRGLGQRRDDRPGRAPTSTRRRGRPRSAASPTPASSAWRPSGSSWSGRSGRTSARAWPTRSPRLRVGDPDDEATDVGPLPEGPARARRARRARRGPGAGR